MNQEVTSYLRTFAGSRRHFLRASAIAGGLTALSHFTPAAIAGFSLGRASAEAGGDLNVLNYALTLEHFENRLYREVVSSGVLSGQAQTYAEVYGSHEAAHVEAITGTINKLGGTPVQEQESYKFPELASQMQVLELLSTVEDVGASAYLGAAPLIQSGELLTVAVQIHTNEAWHATGLRLLVGKEKGEAATVNSVPFAFAEGRSMKEILGIVAGFGVMPSLPQTGAGGMAPDDHGTARTLGAAGLGAAAIAGISLARNRKSEPEETE